MMAGRNFIILMTTWSALVFSSEAYGMLTSHFTFTSNTGNNATVSVPIVSNPSIGDVPLRAGDEIGVFTPGGLCVGAVVWDGVGNKAITVWGDDPMTPELDGLQAGQLMLYRVWVQSTNAEYADVLVSYSMGAPGSYRINGTYILSALTVLGTHTVTATAELHGSITPTGRVIVVHAASQAFTIAPDSGYDLEALFVDGATIVPAPSSYTFLNVTANHTIHARFERVTAVVEEGGQRLAQESMYVLEQNYPNPFNPSTEIRYELPQAGGSKSEISHVTLKIFDLLGREAATLVDGARRAVRYAVQWNAAGFPGGVYFYRLQANGTTVTRSMIVLK